MREGSLGMNIQSNCPGSQHTENAQSKQRIWILWWKGPYPAKHHVSLWVTVHLEERTKQIQRQTSLELKAPSWQRIYLWFRFKWTLECWLLTVIPLIIQIVKELRLQKKLKIFSWPSNTHYDATLLWFLKRSVISLLHLATACVSTEQRWETDTAN